MPPKSFAGDPSPIPYLPLISVTLDGFLWGSTIFPFLYKYLIVKFLSNKLVSRLKTLFRLLVSAVGILATAYLLQDYGVRLDNWGSLAIVTLVMAFLNAFLRPLLILLTLPVTLLTFGIFIFVINALIIYLAGEIVPGFGLSGFLPALLFGIVYSVILSALNWVTGLDED